MASFRFPNSSNSHPELRKASPSDSVTLSSCEKFTLPNPKARRASHFISLPSGVLFCSPARISIAILTAS